jgi:hypothetical protein
VHTLPQKRKAFALCVRPKKGTLAKSKKGAPKYKAESKGNFILSGACGQRNSAHG